MCDKCTRWLFSTSVLSRNRPNGWSRQHFLLTWCSTSCTSTELSSAAYAGRVSAIAKHFEAGECEGKDECRRRNVGRGVSAKARENERVGRCIEVRGQVHTGSRRGYISILGKTRCEN